MGKVRMTYISDVADIQVSYAFTYEFTYCDKCGSFNIGFSSLTGLIAFFLLDKIMGPLYCKKCGNKNITSGNPLNYSNDNQSVIDVPNNQILRIHVETKEI